MDTQVMDIHQQIMSIIAEQLGTKEAELARDSHFRSLPNVDSMRVLQIILKTEKAFGIEISDEVTFRVETVGEFQDLVVQLCQEQAST
jgi:acyl carrier protein